MAGGDLHAGASQNYRGVLRASISRMGLENDVVLLGLVPNAARLYAACDLIIYPALYPDGFGRSTAEAQLAGVAVLATSIGAARVPIEDTRSGLLALAGDASELIDVVSGVLPDPALSGGLRPGGSRQASAIGLRRMLQRWTLQRWTLRIWQ